MNFDRPKGFFALRIPRIMAFPRHLDGEFGHKKPGMDYPLVMTNSLPWYSWSIYRWFTY